MSTRELYDMVRNWRRPKGPIDARVEEPALIALLPEAKRRAAREAFARNLRDAVLKHGGQLPTIRVSCDGNRVIFHVQAPGVTP